LNEFTETPNGPAGKGAAALSTSQLCPFVLAAAVNVAFGSAALMVRSCVELEATPDCALKVSELGLTVNPGTAVTISVTGTFCCAKPASVTVMVPAYTPAANPDGLTKTVTPPGAGAASPPSVSQFPALDAVAVKLNPAAPPENKRD
jgi:hypothetical protein